MTRFRFGVLIVGLSAVFFLAGSGASSDQSDSRRIKQLHRNRSLIQALVDGGLYLAAEKDPLKRADCCNGLAKRFVGEIRQAALTRDVTRAEEMGLHLKELLTRGVAGNLTIVRDQTPLGSAREQDMRRLTNQIKDLTFPLEQELAQLADKEEVQSVLQSVREALGEVDKALKSKRPRSQK
jgi:hypothetical protein